MTPAKLTESQEAAFVSRLQDTSDSVESGIDAIGLDSDDFDVDYLEEVMAENGFERCCECEWWCETGELVDEDGDGEAACESCRPREII